GKNSVRRRGEASWLRGRFRYMPGVSEQLPPLQTDRFASTSQDGTFMCDYLLMGMPNRLARKGEGFVTFRFLDGFSRTNCRFRVELRTEADAHSVAKSVDSAQVITCLRRSSTSTAGKF